MYGFQVFYQSIRQIQNNLFLILMIVLLHQLLRRMSDTQYQLPGFVWLIWKPYSDNFHPSVCLSAPVMQYLNKNASDYIHD